MMKKLIAILKGCLKSFTIWFNSIVATLAVILPSAMEMVPQLQAYVPDNLYKHLLVTLIVGNFLLRVKTNSSLADKGAPK